MKNILQAWTKYADIQRDYFKGPFADKAMSFSKEIAQSLVNEDYPIGEDWKYVNYGQLPKINLHWPEYTDQTQQVADNEFLSIEVTNFSNPEEAKVGPCPDGLTILTPLQALEAGKLNINPRDFNFDNPFFKLTESFWGQGLFFEFNENYKNEKPIKIEFKMDQMKSKDFLCSYNLHFVSYSSNKPQVFIEYDGVSFKGLSNITTTVEVSKNSSLEIFSKEMGGVFGHFILNLFANVERDAHFRHIDMTFPSLWSRHNSDVRLLDSGAHVDLFGAYFDDKDNFTDHHTVIRHLKGNTTSHEDYRGILTGKAKAVFNGKILIDEKASQSNSEQLNKNLMLSKTAEVNTKPELQIYNDDVKAAHGATVGQLDEEQKFYLQSRGYSEDKAKEILAKAFVFDLLESSSDKVKDFYMPNIEQTLNQFEV